MLEYSRLESERKIEQSLQYMISHIKEPFDLNEISKVANTSKFYLIRIFKTVLNETPNRYFRKLKVLSIDRYLSENPEVSLTDLAYEYGYSSSSVLSREFKEFIGHKPKNCKAHFQKRKSNILQIQNNI